MAQPWLQIANARRLYAAQLLRDPNVVGVGSGYKQVDGHVTDQPALVVYVISKTPKGRLPTSRLLPRRLSGYDPLAHANLAVETDVVEVGRVFALGNTGHYRPAPAGVSIGHPATTAGTLGAYVLDRRSGEMVLLSNNHVLAAQNDGWEGDLILQQGPLDGGTFEDALAKLLRWEPLDFESDANLVDAAVAAPLDPANTPPAILGLGMGPNGIVGATVGMLVQKSGRTTGHTADGRVISVDSTFRVDYSYTGSRQAGFQDVVVIAGPERFCQPGDSGALLFSQEADPKATGLLFAGNASGTFALANHIQHVFNVLDVDVLSAAQEVLRGTSWENRHAELRTLRRQVFGALEQGNKYLQVIERHNAELWHIFRRHGELKDLAAQLLLPVLNGLYTEQAGEQILFDQAFLMQMRQLLDGLTPYASVALQNTIAWWRGEMARYQEKTLLQVLKELQRPTALPPQTMPVNRQRYIRQQACKNTGSVLSDMALTQLASDPT